MGSATMLQVALEQAMEQDRLPWPRGPGPQGLGLHHLDGLARLLAKNASGVPAMLARLRDRAEDPEWMARRFVALSDSGVVWAAAWVAPMGVQSGTYLLMGPKVARGGANPRDAAALVAPCVARAWASGARRIETRVPTDDVTPELQQAFDATGGVRKPGRIEFRTPVAGLPSEAGTPMVWRAAASMTEAATLFGEVLRDSGDQLEHQGAALGVLRDYLSDPRMTHDLAAAVHIGSHRGQAVAFVCAQTSAKSGWCTITYMGLVPSARGAGLGHWVHRHGIAMLRAQGGQLYHGGTGLDNAPMRACFVRQGCTPWKRFDVWAWEGREPSATD